MKRRAPASTHVPPSLRCTSSVFGATKRPLPMINSAPVVLKLCRCAAISRLTMSRLRLTTVSMSVVTGPVTTPNCAPCRARCATFALQISFLLGRQAMLGQEPPIQRLDDGSPPPRLRHVPSQQLATFATAKDQDIKLFRLGHAVPR